MIAQTYDEKLQYGAENADEKLPGLHVAFGNPYPEFTGADWVPLST